MRVTIMNRIDFFRHAPFLQKCHQNPPKNPGSRSQPKSNRLDVPAIVLLRSVIFWFCKFSATSPGLQYKARFMRISRDSLYGWKRFTTVGWSITAIFSAFGRCILFSEHLEIMPQVLAYMVIALVDIPLTPWFRAHISCVCIFGFSGRTS